ncbi:helix-turn-helix domain-containing protein [Aquimarina sp. W85]|uniref:helix-turn-helix domain-containing protein n=1 Tax=Aquimarina rhodophyticola TaxID=3342246 RepID=UPI0036700EE4
MSGVKEKRELLNLTQEELSNKSGLSTRTIQRIESGGIPKGHTLKALAKALDCDAHVLLKPQELFENKNYSWIKIINISSVFVTFMPPANIILPLMIMFFTKQFNPLTKQVVSLQIGYTVVAIITFMLSIFFKNWIGAGNQFTMIIMIILILINVAIIFINTAWIDKQKKLKICLNFSII